MIESCRAGISPRRCGEAEGCEKCGSHWLVLCQCGPFRRLRPCSSEVVVKKKENLNWAGNMDVDAWRERQIAKRLKARLEELYSKWEELT